MKKDEREYHERLERRLRAMWDLEDELVRLGAPRIGEMRSDDDDEPND
jgi:hypothetical protein